MRLWNASDTLVSEHPGPGRFVAKRPEMSEAHHMFGPVGSMLLTARSMSPSESRTAVNPEIEAHAIASSVVKTCSVLAVSPTEISSYVLFSINPRFIEVPFPLQRRPMCRLNAIVFSRSTAQRDCNHVRQLPGNRIGISFFNAGSLQLERSGANGRIIAANLLSRDSGCDCSTFGFASAHLESGI